MAEKKCFCHLNGFEVKDAQARRDIDDLYGITQEINDTIGIWDDETKTLTGEALAHRTALENLDGRVEALENSGVGEHVLARVEGVEGRLTTVEANVADAEESIADHEPRITALEGKKLYRHRKTDEIGKNGDNFFISWVVYSYSADDFTFEALTNMGVLSGHIMRDGVMYGIAKFYVDNTDIKARIYISGTRYDVSYRGRTEMATSTIEEVV